MIIILKILLLSLLFISAGHAECIEGNCINGKGIYQFPSGQKFEGNFKNGKPDGITKYTSPDGVTLVKFKNAKPQIKLINEETIVKNSKFSNQKILNINLYVNIVQNYNEINDIEIKSQINDANKIWKQANITFNLKNITRIKIDSAIYSEAESNYIKKCVPRSKCIGDWSYVKILNDLLNLKKNWKKDGINIFYFQDQTFLEPSVGTTVYKKRIKQIKYKNLKYIILPYKVKNKSYGGASFIRKKTLSHELGHVFHLKHTNKFSLMRQKSDSNVYLSESECDKARKIAKKIFN